jgi:hypothetical protein
VALEHEDLERIHTLPRLAQENHGARR